MLDPSEQTPTGQRELDVSVGRAWRDHRRYLLDVAFGVTGNLAEAEDILQEAFTRLTRVDIGSIDDVRAWLVVVVTRLCLDSLRNSRRHLAAQESILDPRLAVPAEDPADRATLDDNICVALQVVLNRLTPSERAVFVLHDVFQYRFDEIARIVGRTPVACRQLASRARRAIAADSGIARFEVQSAEQREITSAFLDACTTGDLAALLVLLDPDVDGESEGGLSGGIVTVRGAEAVAEATLRYLGPRSRSVLVSVPAGARGQVVAVRERRLIALVAFDIRDGRIHHFDAIADPKKLLSIAPALGL
jgi:RNA polymerase sigma-70 factor (ECF subfamily)